MFDLIKLLVAIYTVVCAILFQANLVDRDFAQKQVDFLNRTLNHVLLRAAQIFDGGPNNNSMIRL